MKGISILIRSHQATTLSRRAVLGGMLAASIAPRSAMTARPPSGSGIPILAYHRFDPVTPGPTMVTVGAFESQLALLARQGYAVVPLREAVAALRMPAPARQAAITVDDGHESVHATLFPLIRRHRLPVTLFIYPSAISNASYALTWEQLAEMRGSGHVEVQSHTYWHPNFRTERRRLAPAAYAAFVDDQLRRSRKAIETRLGGRVDMLAWPFGIVDDELERAARRAGYAAGFAYGGGAALPGADQLALPRIPVGNADRGAAFARKIAADPEPRR